MGSACTCQANAETSSDITAKNIRNSAVIAAVLTVIGGGGFAWHHGWQFLPLSYDHPFFRMAALFGLFGLAYWFIVFLWQIPVKHCQTHWWDYADEPDAMMRWEVVRLLTIGDEEYGPFGSAPNAGLEPKTRGSVKLRMQLGLTMWAVFVIFLCLLVEGIHFLWSPHIPAIFAFQITNDDNHTSTPSLANAATNLSGNLTAILALVAAIISIYFTHKQLQAKVRADNRQAWIEKLRKLISDTIALAAEHASAEAWKREALWAKLNPSRLELELMLNPTERDHMLLIFLVQRMAFLKGEATPRIQDAETLPSKIRGEYCCDAKYHESWDGILREAAMHMLVTYSMRLSHVVLKREWERVKATR